MTTAAVGCIGTAPTFVIILTKKIKCHTLSPSPYKPGQGSRPQAKQEFQVCEIDYAR